MHDNPGSIVLTDYLTEIIREQHHKGARVVISTQEPTVSPELIALCSITVIHRFTSPTWFAAIKKHINGIEDSQKTMNDIECLETGEALVYAPNAVLGKNKDITLIKATGRLLKLNIRNRVTLNDGVSIMAV
jgi:DNA helicase HerA-like ATPase